jgi:hypothetical protein
MKKILLLALSFVFLTACELEETEEITDVRDRFIGEWVCEEVSNVNGSRNFTVTIAYDESDASNILIQNFYQMGIAISSVGTISTTNEQAISISPQDVDGLLVQGSGVLESDVQIDFEYTVDDGVELDSVQSVFIKQ